MLGWDKYFRGRHKAFCLFFDVGWWGGGSRYANRRRISDLKLKQAGPCGGEHDIFCGRCVGKVRVEVKTELDNR